MGQLQLKDKTFELYIPEKQIKEAIARIAEQIKDDMKGKNPLYVVVLNGAFVFASELLKELNEGSEIAFARYASYEGTSSTGVVREVMPLQVDVQGRTLVLIEDIVDTGRTMFYVKDLLRQQGATDVRLATLLFKPKALRCDLQPDYVGLEIPNAFIVGYGLDYDGWGRGLRDIYQVVE